MTDADDAATMLLVVDVQNGFLNEHTRHILTVVNALMGAFAARNQAVALTRFVNRPGSGFDRWIGWTRFMHSPENDICDELDAGAAPVFIKHGYTAFTPAFEKHLGTLGIGRLVLCGIATDGCVLKSAVDAFERGIEPLVATDACASHGGHEVHEAGLLLLGRFIGKDQLRSAESFM